MIVLSLDTTMCGVEAWLGKIEHESKCGNKCDVKDKKILCKTAFSPHVEDVIDKFIFDILTESGILLPDLVIINRGPGSFTSTRVGISFVNGWFQGSAEKFKVLGICGLKAVGEYIRNTNLGKRNFIIGQEERGERFWIIKCEGYVFSDIYVLDSYKICTLKDDTDLFLMKRVDQSKIVFVDKNGAEISDLSLTYACALIGYKRFIGGKISNILKIVPIYSGKTS